MKRTKIKELLQRTDFGTEVCVKGWVRTRRGSKSVSFIALNDGSTIKNVQIVADVEKFDGELLKLITTGACLCVEGTLVESQGAGQAAEIQATKIEVYGTCGSDYPMQKKGQTFEYMRQHAHLRLRTNTFGAIFRIRHQMSMAIHTYFHEHGFCYDFFGQSTGLTVSGQLEGELGATALGAIYTFGPTFRAENSNTPRHLAEFWMIEPEVAFMDLTELMDLEEDFIKHCVRWALEHCAEDLEFLNKMIDNTLLDRLHSVIDTEFVRLPYTEGIRLLEEAIAKGKKFEFPVYWGCDLASEHERYLVEEHFKKPVIMIDYPKEIKSFYMKTNEDGKTVQGTDVLFPQIGEIIGGSVREEDYDTLVARAEEIGVPHKDIWWYLDIRKYGTCPHAGFGLGFERLMLFVTGMQNIRDVIPFPRTPKSAQF